MAISREDTGELLALHAGGRFVQMEVRAQALLLGAPEVALLHELLGLARMGQGRDAQAVEDLQRAAEIDPGQPQFWENLALCERRLGAFDRSEASLRRSLALRPDSVEALNALGSVLRSLRRYDEAIEILQQALARDPNHLGARVNLANALFDAGLFGRAETEIRRVIASRPKLAIAHGCLGAICNTTGRYAEGAAAAQAIVDIVGGLGGLTEAKADMLNMAANLFSGAHRDGAAAQVYRETLAFGHIAARPVAVLGAARRVCDWDLADSVEAQARDASQKPWTPGPGTVFPLLAVAAVGPKELRSATRNYAQYFAANVTQRPAPHRSRDRLRVGYLTRDLTDFPVGYLVVGAIEAHDRDRFEIVAYDYTPPSTGAFRNRIAAAFERLIAIDKLSDSEAAQRIRDDACDVVVDLTGWTSGTRSAILATRPAAVQVQWLGYPGTMGAPWLDYIIADRVLVRPGEELHYSEKVVRLARCYQPNDDKRVIGAPLSRQEYGLPANAFVFCSFNQAYKITREIFDVWMQLLVSVDGSVLWLLSSDPAAVEALQRAAQARAIAPERLIFAPFLPPAEHLARAGTADLALDCFPYGSHTTASDMLWASLPFVALAGDTFASRVSASILTAAGFPELIANSIAEYRALALRLACDRASMIEIKAKVAHARSTSALFETAGFTRHLEQAYRVIAERNRAGLPPDHLLIE